MSAIGSTYSCKLDFQKADGSISFHRSKNQSDKELYSEIVELVSRKTEIPKEDRIGISTRYLFLLQQDSSMHESRYLFAKGKLGEKREDYPETDGPVLLKKGIWSKSKVIPPGIGLFSIKPKETGQKVNQFTVSSSLIGDPYGLLKKS